jgi:hypothetical protein
MFDLNFDLMQLKYTKIVFILLLAIFFLFVPKNIYSNINSIYIEKDSIISADSLMDCDTSRIVLDASVLDQFYFPIHGKVISHFGRRGRRMHTGTDIKLNHGDTVKAAFTGVVTKASRYYGYGILVVLKHPDNLETYYGHLSKELVDPGDTVEYGTPIGLGGRTGRATTDHLHFELRKDRRPMNAERYFDFNQIKVKNWGFTGIKEPKIKKHQESQKSEKDTVASEPATSKQYHRIKSGDTLYALSKKYKTTVDNICHLNQIKPHTTLKLGRKLRVK